MKLKISPSVLDKYNTLDGYCYPVIKYDQFEWPKYEDITNKQLRVRLIKLDKIVFELRVCGARIIYLARHNELTKDELNRYINSVSEIVKGIDTMVRTFE